MENFLLSLILDEGSVILTALILIVAGGFIGSRIFTVEIALRRVTYLWFLAGCNILLTISQLGWLMSGAAADQGLISAFILLQLSFFIIFGAAVYYGSAARSNDIKGTTDSAWLAFVPLANLWLLFKRGEHTASQSPSVRSAFARYVGDPLLVLAALCVMAISQVIERAMEESSAFEVTESAALREAVSAAQTLEEAFRAEAEASSRQLPMRIDEVTVFRKIAADGKTLKLYFDVERDIPGFRADFKSSLAAEQCAPEMFLHDLSRGGTIMYIYTGPSGNTIDTFLISKADCDRTSSGS